MHFSVSQNKHLPLCYVTAYIGKLVIFLYRVEGKLVCTELYAGSVIKKREKKKDDVVVLETLKRDGMRRNATKRKRGFPQIVYLPLCYVTAYIGKLVIFLYRVEGKLVCKLYAGSVIKKKGKKER